MIGADGGGVTTALHSDVPGLLELARDEGSPDVFAGKRAYARYTIGVSTKLTTDPVSKSDAWSVVTHSISGGGVGLWSRERLDTGTAVHVLDVNDSAGNMWLPGHVQHCSVGIRGYLIGVSFDYPLPPDDEHAALRAEHASAAIDIESRAPIAVQTAPAIAELRFVTCGAFGAFIAFVVSHQFTGDLPPPGQFALTSGIAVLVGVLVGFLFGCFFTRMEGQYIRVLRQMVRDASNGRPMHRAEVKCPTAHLATLHGSLCDLGNRVRLRQEDERLQRQKLEEITQIKSNILAIVSHDMRTPLTSILLYAQMLLDEVGTLDIEEETNFLDIIHSECTRLSRLVDDLLEVQRLESDRVKWDMQTHDLTDTVRSCVSVFDAMASNKNIELRVDCQENMPPIEADSDKLTQVLSNLVSNALKYTEANGTVEVSAHLQRSDFILRVADSGPGIARDQWDQIFDRFTQVRDPNTSNIAGVGLGLYIVKKIVEGHGGSVWVNSEPGQGSEFVVSIPRNRRNPGQRELSPALAGKKVLVCDPDPELASTMSSILREEGLEVRTAHSGNRLMAHLDPGDLDLVITDVLLPDVSGPELLDRLMHVNNKGSRLIVHSYEGDGQDFSVKGVDVFLRRPVSRQDLLDAVQAALKKRPTEGHKIVAVQRGDFDTERFSAFFAAHGHTLMIAESLDEAAALVRDFAIDILVLPETLLDPEWDQLDREPFSSRRDTRVVVLCESVRHKQQELACAIGLTVLRYRRGQEHSIAEAIIGTSAPRESESVE